MRERLFIRRVVAQTLSFEWSIRAHDVAYRVKWTTLIEQWPNHFCMSFFDFPPIEGPSLIHVDRDEYQYARSCQPF